MANSKQALLLSLLPALLVGCMVGPNFHSPAPPHVHTYTRGPLPQKTVSIPKAGLGGKAQAFTLRKEIPAEWWELFHSKELNRLVELGIANSPTLQAAKAALRQSQELLYAQIGSTMLPAFNAAFTAQRQRFSADTIGVSGNTSGFHISPLFNLYNLNVNISYTLDIFGGLRREIESMRAQVDYQCYELAAAYLTLTSNIVTTAIQIASLRAQIATTIDLIRFEDQQLRILNKQFELGGIGKPNVLTQQILVSQTKASLPVLQQALVQSQNALAVLIGSFPSEAAIPNFDLDKLDLPAKLPVSIPSALVHQRPDIAAAEALLHVASAQIGVATANLFPQVTIGGYDGWEAATLTRLFGPTKKIWDIVGNVAQPVFRGGSLLAQRRAAIDAYEQAYAQYKQVVLQAFQNVADVLRAIENDAKTLQAQKTAEIAAREALNLTQQQFILGGVSYLALLINQQQYQQAVIYRIRAEATRYSDTAALFQAMGGGWWKHELA